jgi:uncharacterized protein YkwD
LLLVGAVVAQSDEAGARHLADLVNQERQRAGLPALAWSDRIAGVAAQHAQLMAEHGELSHQFPGETRLRDRLVATGLHFSDDAENVAFDDDVDEAHASLMKSPLHRENILSGKYNAMGAAVLRKGDRVYVVEDFAYTFAELSADEVAARVLAAFNERRQAAGLRPAVSAGTYLHQAACRMAEADKLQLDLVRAPHATSVAAFTAFQMQALPSSVLTRVREPQIRSVAIGACFARSPTYPAGTYWVVMAFY